MTGAVSSRPVALGNRVDLRRGTAVRQGTGRDAVMPRRLTGDMQERPIMPSIGGIPECREDGVRQSGSQSNTSPERSSGMNAAFNAGAA